MKTPYRNDWVVIEGNLHLARKLNECSAVVFSEDDNVGHVGKEG